MMNEHIICVFGGLARSKPLYICCSYYWFCCNVYLNILQQCALVILYEDPLLYLKFVGSMYRQQQIYGFINLFIPAKFHCSV
jgi:hypothetical protein